MVLFIYLVIHFKVIGIMHLNRHFCKCARLAILANFQMQSLGRFNDKKHKKYIKITMFALTDME